MAHIKVSRGKAMKGTEILKQIKEQRSSGHCFIKWWRKENDFVDYDLLERFVADLNPSEEISGFELLGIEPMWQELQRIGGGRVTKVRKGSDETIVWEKASGKKKECPYTPDSIISIFDAETKGNPVD